jgi:putative SOS response-associated peptidase YedK
MCGRFAQIFDDKALMERFRLEDVSERIQPRFNLSPGMKVNAIMENGNRFELKTMMWGFSDLHGKPLPSLIFNSRLDTLMGRSQLGEYLIRHRCVIPVTGFYEWSGKQPYFIRSAGEEIMCLAAVFTHDDEGFKCSVATTDSIGLLKNIHHRMPLILSSNMPELWLKGKFKAEKDLVEEAGKMTGELEFVKVSQAVNDAGFESPDCIKMIEEGSLF